MQVFAAMCSLSVEIPEKQSAYLQTGELCEGT